MGRALVPSLAAASAILMAVVASFTVDRGFDRLFSRQTQSLVENAASVANAYLEERLRNARLIGVDIQSGAGDAAIDRV